MRDDPLFAEVARQHRIRPPALVTSTHEEWFAYCRRVWALYPPWGYAANYVEEAARDFLPRVLAQMTIGRRLGRLAPDAWRPGQRRARLHVLPIDEDDDGDWVMFRLTPDLPDILLLNDFSFEWHCLSLKRMGEGLIELGAWRWDVSRAKAAWRIGRLAGLARPVP